MKCQPAVVLCLLIVWDLAGFVIFLRGFLVLKLAVPGSGTAEQQPAEPILPRAENYSDIRGRPPYDRLVLVLIDALRSDFILPDKNSDLPKMKQTEMLTAQGRTLSFVAKSHPPTVTMPRIKALTSGGVPGFIDVILNFDSKRFAEDNLISQMKSAGRQIVFYGDDTWIQLFPDHFVRSEGTTSFFVTDYIEVDNNVTRHLDGELAAEDWDALVLHYLGLDHIGHIAGPRSPLVPLKLQEMDNIIQKILMSVEQQDRLTGRSTLVVVCGDHGMSDQGGHGGSSHYETSTPLVLLSQQFTDKGVPFNGTIVQQVDLVPSLSLLLGLPVPQNNLGVMIDLILQRSWATIRERLQALHINAVQLSKVFAFSFRSYEKEQCYLELQRAIQGHKDWLEHHVQNKNVDADQLGQKIMKRYYSALYQMRDKLMANRISYDTHAMRFGIGSIWLVLLTLIYTASGNGSGLDVSFAPTGWLTFASLLGLLSSTHFLECLGPEGSPFLCGTDLVSIATIAILVLASSFWITVMVSRLFYFWSPRTSKLHLPGTMLGKWLMATVLFHSFTLLASSFVEEEHQTCYFIASTSLILIAIESIIQAYRNQESFNQSESCMGLLHGNIYFKEKNSSDSLKKASGGLQFKRTSQPVGGHLKVIWPIGLYVTSAACLTRILRAYNRTGDKWAHLPDIGDWLVLPDSKVNLSLLCAGALLSASILVSIKPHHYFFKMLFVIGVCMVYVFRAATGALLIPFTTLELTKGIPEARAVYIIIAMLFIHIIWRYNNHTSRKPLNESGERDQWSATRTSASIQSQSSVCDQLKCIWVMLMFFLLRPHNIPLVAMVFLLEEVLGRLTSLASVSRCDLVLLYYWFGQASFFWQGNSNSISTVDVSAGYVGLSEYEPLLIGLLMCLSTYAGPVFWMVSLAHRCTSSQDKFSRNHLATTCTTLWMTRALPLAVYTVQVMVQRYHLFVWTVFSPKLLYEGMHTLVMAAMMLPLLVTQVINS